MVELVVTIMIIGIIAVVGMPQFFGASRFTEMGFADTTANSLRYAHKLAMASGCDTRVQINSASLDLFQRATDCSTGSFSKVVLRPGGAAFSESVPSGVTVSGLDIYFDSQGRPWSHAGSSLLSSAGTVNIGSRTVTVEAVTGFVHQ